MDLHGLSNPDLTSSQTCQNLGLRPSAELTHQGIPCNPYGNEISPPPWNCPRGQRLYPTRHMVPQCNLNHTYSVPAYNLRSYSSPLNCLTSYNPWPPYGSPFLQGPPYATLGNASDPNKYTGYVGSTQKVSPNSSPLVSPDPAMWFSESGTDVSSSIKPEFPPTSVRGQHHIRHWAPASTSSPNTSMDRISECSSSTTTSSAVDYDPLLMSPQSVEQSPASSPFTPASVPQPQDTTDILAAAVATLNDNSTQEKAVTCEKLRGTKKKPKLLNPKATSIMQMWFDSHLDHPYPTPAEKQMMAQQGGITLAQVNSWFNNRRNRSSNTAPKRQKRKLQQQLATLCEDILSSKSGEGQAGQIVQELNTLIQASLSPTKKKRP